MIFTQANMETAMCLWEAANEGTLSPLAQQKLDARRAQFGTAELRHAIIGLVPGCEAAWEADRETERERVPYDWEHCPAWLSKFIEEFW